MTRPVYLDAMEFSVLRVPAEIRARCVSVSVDLLDGSRAVLRLHPFQARDLARLLDGVCDPVVEGGH